MNIVLALLLSVTMVYGLAWVMRRVWRWLSRPNYAGSIRFGVELIFGHQVPAEVERALAKVYLHYLQRLPFGSATRLEPWPEKGPINHEAIGRKYLPRLRARLKARAKRSQDSLEKHPLLRAVVDIESHTLGPQAEAVKFVLSVAEDHERPANVRLFAELLLLSAIERQATAQHAWGAIRERLLSERPKRLGDAALLAGLSSQARSQS